VTRLRIRTDGRRLGRRRWWTPPAESRAAPVVVAAGIAVFAAGMGLYLLRRPLAFAFLAVGPMLFVVAFVLDAFGGRRGR